MFRTILLSIAAIALILSVSAACSPSGAGRPEYDLQTYPDFFKAMKYAVRTKDFPYLQELLDGSVHIQDCTAGVCASREETAAETANWLKTRFSSLAGNADFSELLFSANQSDVRLFTQPTAHAENTFAVGPSDEAWTLLLGFADTGSRYYVTDILLAAGSWAPPAGAQPEAEAASPPAPAGASEPTLRILGSPEDLTPAPVDQLENLYDLAQKKYSQDEENRVGSTLSYTIYLPESRPVRWGVGWCAATQEIRNQNLEHMRFELVVPGQQIPRSTGLSYYTESPQEWCFYKSVVLTDWQPGEHHLRVILVILEAIHDGWNEFPPGTITRDYTVIVGP